MPAAPQPWLTTFRCPQCGASYKVVRVDAAGLLNEARVNCLVCGKEFPGHDGAFFLKYFLTPVGV